MTTHRAVARANRVRKFTKLRKAVRHYMVELLVPPWGRCFGICGVSRENVTDRSSYVRLDFSRNRTTSIRPQIGVDPDRKFVFKVYGARSSTSWANQRFRDKHLRFGWRWIEYHDWHGDATHVSR